MPPQRRSLERSGLHRSGAQPGCPVTAQPDRRATYPHQPFLGSASSPSLWHWGSLSSSSVVQRSPLQHGAADTCSSLCLSLFILESPSSWGTKLLPQPSVTAELFSVKGRRPTVQNVPICWQDEPNQNQKFKPSANFKTFIILTSWQLGFCLQWKITSQGCRSGGDGGVWIHIVWPKLPLVHFILTMAFH